jgi:hypothetical protein
VGQITITDDAAGSPQSVLLSGTGLVAGLPTLSLSASALTFPNTTLGTRSASQGVTLTNTGPAPLVLASISASFEFPTTTTCPATLGPGGSCNIFVAFEPQAAGTRTDNVVIASNAPTSPDRVALAGIGVLVRTGALVARPDGISFAPAVGVGTRSATVPLILANTGSAPVTLASITVEGDFAVNGSCASIAAGSSCTLAVEFAPTQIGIRDGMIVVRSDASNAILAIALDGRGAPVEAEATLSATSLAFGNQFQFVLSAAQTLTLANTGLAPLAVSQIAASGNFVQDNDCATTLAPGASCHINVRMFGTYPGPASGVLRVLSNSAPVSSQLSGTTCRLYSSLRAQRGLLTCAP